MRCIIHTSHVCEEKALYRPQNAPRWPRGARSSKVVRAGWWSGRTDQTTRRRGPDRRKCRTRWWPAFDSSSAFDEDTDRGRAASPNAPYSRPSPHGRISLPCVGILIIYLPHACRARVAAHAQRRTSVTGALGQQRARAATPISLVRVPRIWGCTRT